MAWRTQAGMSPARPLTNLCMETPNTPASVFEAEIAAVPEAEWRSELKQSVKRFHMIAVWAAIFFDPLVGLADFFNIPEQWLSVFYLRLGVSALTLAGVFLHKRKVISTYFLVAIPIVLISVQNAITYQLIENEHLLGHNLNYLMMVMGAGLFLTWPPRYNIVTFCAVVVVSMGTFLLNPALDPSHYIVEGGILLLSAMVFSIFLIHARYTARMREIKGRLALEKTLELVVAQRDEIEEKNQILEEQARDLQAAKAEIQSINEQLAGQNSLLEQLVDERTAALRKSSSERDTLVYRLSHDFKTPMVNIRSMVSLVERFPDADQKATFFQKIYDSLNRFDGLVRDLESFPVYARETLCLEPLDLEQMVAIAWDSLVGLRSSGDDFSISIPSPVQLVSDREKFQAIVLALLSNSLLYRHSERPLKIAIAVRPSGDRHLVSFQDNGAGIPADILDRVFELFFRGDNRSKGTGLGLYLVQGIAGQLGGNVRISSEVGVGTEVVVELG